MVKTFYFNPYRECTYIIYTHTHAIIIDPGMSNDREEQRVQQFIEEQQLTPIAMLITHTHPDHICGVDWVREHYGLEPIIYPEEGNLTIADTTCTVIRTPGHKEDCVCYLFAGLEDGKDVLFSGDTIFRESVGRTDLPGGDMSLLLHSLQHLKRLPDETLIYPGHGYTTSIGYEKQYNPYL